MAINQLDTQQKALRINLDRECYGTFAEIGAGQEVARWFFQAGGAAGTVAKTISAYDMTVSDAIYGHSDRYVSRKRLETMLSYEYDLLLDRLGPKRANDTAFFSFANTVAIRGYNRREDGNGWLGIRYQVRPGARPSEIIIHVIARDSERLRQQDALGILGVNLIYGAIYMHQKPERMITSLFDQLSRERVEIDMIKFSGQAFEGVDNRLMSLKLVEKELTDAAMFTAEGEVVQAAELLYKRPVLLERGRFKPITLLTQDLIRQALAQFMHEPELNGEEPVVLLEMTLKGLMQSEEGIDTRDFLQRAESLRSLGHNVLVSNHGPFYRLVEDLSRCTQRPMRIALGVPGLQSILDPQFYSDLPGRELEAIGRLFHHNVRLYLYPYRNPLTGEIETADSLKVPPNATMLYAHLRQNRFVQPITNYDPTVMGISADEVLAQLRNGDPAWERSVPPAIMESIRRGRLFGYTGA